MRTPAGLRKTMMRVTTMLSYIMRLPYVTLPSTHDRPMYPITTLTNDTFPHLLREISDPPEMLYLRGTLPPPEYALLTVVGSRAYTSYGKQAAEHLIRGLAGQPVSIVSGLAIGIDSIAHKAALDAGLHTIAIPGSGLNDHVLYPRTHKMLAQKILDAGGALLSEFDPDFEATPWCFAQRNRIVAGISHATLVIEAKERSGTLITARLAVDYNRDVLVVPGSIFSGNSAGPHLFMRLGATPVRSSEDILDALNLTTPTNPSKPIAALTSEEERVLDALIEPTEREQVIAKIGMSSRDANVLFSMMELRGYIEERSGKLTRLI